MKKIAEEMLADIAWPVSDKNLVIDEFITLAIQINGKLKVAIEMAKDASKEEVEKAALANDKVKAALVGQLVRKIIIVPNRIVNVVI